MKQTITTIVCFSAIGSVINPAATAQTPYQNNDMAQFLLREIRQARQKVRNLRYTAVYREYESPERFQRNVDLMAVRLSQKYPAERVQKTIHGLERAYAKYRFQRLDMAIDREQRTRVETVYGPATEQGTPIDVDSLRRVTTWDGENAIRYNERPGDRRGAVLSNSRPFAATKRYRQPWRQFGGIFFDRFSEAGAENASINVQRTEDGLYRVTIFRGEDRKEIGTLDPSQGYSLVLTEHYDGRRLTGRHKATFTEVSPGVWFPVRGEEVWFSKDDPPEVELQYTVEVSDVVVNDPNFYDGLFHVDFPEGTAVLDQRTGLTYIVGESMSETPALASGVHSLHDIAMDALDDMAEEAGLFVPKVGLAVEEGEAFVLDLADSKLVNPREKPESEESHNYLKELGKGDIAWDGTVVATRGAKVLTTKQESKRPLKLTKGKWTSSYKLPKKVELPYSMLVVTRDRVNFLIRICKIEPNGITLAYRQLNPDELSRYRQ